MRFFDSTLRLALYLALAICLGLAVGCREEGNVKAGQGANGHAATAGSRVSLGELGYVVLRANVAQSDTDAQAKVNALEQRHDEFVTAIDTMLPAEVTDGIRSTLDAVLDAIRDNTIPTITDNAANTLALLADDPDDPNREALGALVTLTGAKPAIDGDTAMRLLSRLTQYPQLDELFDAIGHVVAENDGMNADGQPTGFERDLLGDLVAGLSDTLRHLERPAAGEAALIAPELVDTLLSPIELRGTQVGGPAWAVRLDANGNPVVRRAGGQILAPFVDRDRDGMADVDAEGFPVDTTGQVIEIAAFDEQGARDGFGRAMTAGGALLYDYFDVKQTPLGQAARMTGDLVRADVLVPVVAALDRMAPRTTGFDPQTGESFPVYTDDNPVLDLAWSGLEVFRYRDAPKLLDAFAALIDSDPVKAEQLLVKLLDAAEIVANTPSAPASGQAASGSLLDEIVPLLDRTFEVQAGGQSAGRMLLQTFTAEQARLRNLPMGFARMMKYSDWAQQIPTQPGQQSMMERLLNMMEEASHCEPSLFGWKPFGNLADFYLKVMAGEEKILGITLKIETVNLLMDIPALRNLICSQISEANVRALAAFAQSGSLDAVIPVATAFVHAGQTRTLRDIFLTLQNSYAQTMRPHEAALVQVLESGAVELVFEVLDDMNRTRVPGTNEVVSDVIADFLEALVDDDRYVENRRGQPVPSLAHLLIEPLDALSARMGQDPALDRAVSDALDIVLATWVDDNNTPWTSGDDRKVLLNHGLIPITASALESLAGSMSIYPWVRNADITRYQQDMADLFTGRTLPLVVDVFAALDRSGRRMQIHQALTNLLSPNLNAGQDVYGSVLEVAAAVLQAKSDPRAMTDLLRFAGRAMRPDRGWVRAIALETMDLLGGDAGATLIDVVRNGLDRGPNGTLRSPIETILDVFEAIGEAGQTPAGPTTVDSVRDSLLDLVDLLRDDQDGLWKIWNNVQGR